MASCDRGACTWGWSLIPIVLLPLSLLAFYFDWFKVEDPAKLPGIHDWTVSSPLPEFIPDIPDEHIHNNLVEIIEEPACVGVADTDGQSQESFVDALLEHIETLEVQSCAEPVRQLAAILFELNPPDSRVLVVLDNIARNDPGTVAGKYAQDALDDYYRKEAGEVTREERLYQELIVSAQVAQPTPGDIPVDTDTLQVKAEPDPAVISEIIGMARYPESEDQRKFAVGLLRQYQPESAINVLDGLVADDDESVSFKALKDLSYMLGDQGVDNDQILTVVEQATDDPREAIALEATRIQESWYAMRDEMQANSEIAEASAHQPVNID